MHFNDWTIFKIPEYFKLPSKNWIHLKKLKKLLNILKKLFKFNKKNFVRIKFDIIYFFEDRDNFFKRFHGVSLKIN